MFINRGKKVDMNNKETQESNTVKNESKTVIKKAVSIIGLLFISTIIIYFLFSGFSHFFDRIKAFFL